MEKRSKIKNKEETMEIQSTQTSTTKKKKGRFLKGFLIFIIIVIIVVIALGFLFPGLLWKRNLGLSYSESDYKSAIYKINHVNEKDTTTYFSSEELTAFFNEEEELNKIIRQAQVKLGEDNTIKISGSANIEYILDNLLSEKYSKVQLEEKIPAFGILPENVNLYIDMDTKMQDGKASTTINDIQIQGISLPESMITKQEISNMLQENLNDLLSDTNISNVNIQNGELVIKNK